MTTYSEFLDEYRDASYQIANRKEFNGREYRKFLSMDKKFHKIEDINIANYKEFLRKALNTDGHMHAAIIDDPKFPNYKIAILKNWQKQGKGKIDITLAFPNDPIQSLYERISSTTFNSLPIIDGFKKFNDMDAYVHYRLIACYEEVVQSRFIDYNDNGGNLKDWQHYLVSPNDQEEIGNPEN